MQQKQNKNLINASSIRKSLDTRFTKKSIVAKSNPIELKHNPKRIKLLFFFIPITPKSNNNEIIMPNETYPTTSMPEWL